MSLDLMYVNICKKKVLSVVNVRIIFSGTSSDQTNQMSSDFGEFQKNAFS